MKNCVLLYLALSFAFFGFGVSLQCYSCPHGVFEPCEVTQECKPGEDSCLKLEGGGKTYTSCLRYADCNAIFLASTFPVPDATFSCCQTEQCNRVAKSFYQKFKDFFS